jgi:sucrose-phosphate synthase
MLRGDPLGGVVGNFSHELAKLKGQRNIYFAKKKYAGGVLEAIQHYKFTEKTRSK